MEDIEISDVPKIFSGYCASISRGLMELLAFHLPKRPGFTLSVGSGSGLLEALIMAKCGDVLIEGVEVGESINRYIPQEACNVVSGTWDTSTKAIEASAWLFIYPRDYSLIRKYLDKFESGAVTSIIWIGPAADVPEVPDVFKVSYFEEVEIENAKILQDSEAIKVFKKLSEQDDTH